MQSKILIIKGSARKKGNTQLVVDAIRAKIPTTYIDLQDHNISYYDYEHKNQADDFLGIAKECVRNNLVIYAVSFALIFPLKSVIVSTILLLSKKN